MTTHLPNSGVVVFSGGSAANSLVDVFNHLVEAKDCPLSYVIPISDNGGSSSELIRVLGGPGIGDVRSRLVRLIPDHGDTERNAIKNFFNHRLSADPNVARMEWLDIVEARHELWTYISSAKKELIRSFLNLLNLEIVKRARPSSVFNFANASIGNMFLTGARLFSGSFESAIYLLSSIGGVPSNISVLPAINTNFSHHIRAGLTDGTYITGQNSISHPSDPTALPSAMERSQSLPQTSEPGLLADDGVADHRKKPRTSTEVMDTIEDANWPGSLPVLRQPYITFTKSQGSSYSGDLPSRIERVWYINPYGQEIRIAGNPDIISAIASAETLVYSIGSLYTSIIPNLVLKGVGAAIAGPATSNPESRRANTTIFVSDTRQKILILNGSLDRETSGSHDAFTALDFIRAVSRACRESQDIFDEYVEDAELVKYVTHLIYMEAEGTPKVERERLAGLGIECVRVYGRGAAYDQISLRQALVAITGKKSSRGEKSRRNTLEN